jgi:polar amino acid transport system substrate-binding protein
MHRKKGAAAAAVMVAALLVSGCSDSDTPRLEEKIVVEPDAAAVDLLPEGVSGSLTVAINPEYQPNEYLDESGNLIGWTVDLADAIAQKLGLTFEYREVAFDSIIPGVVDGTFDVGFSSFTDNEERRELVNFVDYYDAGIQWAQVVGGSVNPDEACGLTVAVQAGTYQETDELPAKSEACVAAGKAPITVLPVATQTEATTSLVLERADAMSADSPITLNAVSLIKDQIEVAGEAFDVAPYGIALGKESGLELAIQAAIRSLIADGNYLKVLDGWGVADGSREDITINGGV